MRIARFAVADEVRYGLVDGDPIAANGTGNGSPIGLPN